MSEQLKPCLFCGGKVNAAKGFGNITFFRCANSDCLAVVSFGGNKRTSDMANEAANPTVNWNRRATQNTYWIPFGAAPSEYNSLSLAEIEGLLADIWTTPAASAAQDEGSGE